MVYTAFIGSYFSIPLNCRQIHCVSLTMASWSPALCSRIIATPDWPTSGPEVLDTACTASGVVQCEGHRGEGWIKVSRGHHCEQERQSCGSAHYSFGITSTSKQVSFHGTHTALSPTVPVSTCTMVLGVAYTIPFCGHVTFPSEHFMQSLQQS